MPLDTDHARYLYQQVPLPESDFPRWLRPYTIDRYSGGTLLSAALACLRRDTEIPAPDDTDEQLTAAAHTMALAAIAGIEDLRCTDNQLVWIGAPLIAGRVSAGAIATACHATGDPRLGELADQVITTIWPSIRRFHRDPHSAIQATSHLRKHLADWDHNSHSIHPALKDLITLGGVNAATLPVAVHHLNRTTATSIGSRPALKQVLGESLASCYLTQP
jgi:hypothetical protein